MPVVTAVAFETPETVTGAELLVAAVKPPLPMIMPQHCTAPDCSTTHVVLSPVATMLAVEILGTATGEAL